MTSLIEVAVYAAVLAHGTPLNCAQSTDTHIDCSNGTSAELAENAVIRFSGGVTVDRDENGFPRFSDGTHSWYSSTGWIAFSNGMQIRKVTADRYKLSTDVECHLQAPETAECKKVEPH